MIQTHQKTQENSVSFGLMSFDAYKQCIKMFQFCLVYTI